MNKNPDGTDRNVTKADRAGQQSAGAKGNIPGQDPSMPPEGTETTPTETQEHYASEVSGAVLRVQQLIKYAAEAGKPIDTETQQFIAVFSRKVINGNSWTTEEEAAFWSAICSLSVELAPVTYDTLESSGAIAKKYVSFFGGLTLLLLAFLVYAQFVWVVLNNATGTVEALVKETNKAEIKITQLDIQQAAIEIELVNLERVAGDTTIEMAEQLERGDRIRLLKENKRSNQILITETNFIHREVRGQLVASTRILVGWLPFQGWLRTTRPPEPSFWDSDDEAMEKQKNISEWEMQQIQESSFRNKALHTWAKQILQGMSAYLLPMIYGLVGACAFVLRSMSRQIRELTFSAADSTVQYMLRLVLGALAGISIGWFLKPDPSATEIISTVSPLALAFVAGYSVELLFTAMDKVIKAFTGAGPGQPKTQSDS